MEENLISSEKRKAFENVTPEIVKKYGFVNQDPYTSANWISRLFLYWAYRIIKMANHVKIKSEYMGKLMGEYTSQKYLKSLKYVWENKGYKYKKRLALIQTGFRANIVYVFAVLFFACTKTLINILNMAIFREYMKKFSSIQSENKSFFDKFSHWEIGIMYLGLRLFEIFFMRKSFEYQTFLGFKSGTEFSCLIFEKLLKVSPASMKDKARSGEVINFIQVDAHKLTFLMLSSPDLVTFPTQIISYSYMLFKYFGISFIFGLVTLIIFLFINFYFQRKFKKTQKEQMKLKDKRMKVTTETFNNIKVLKLYSWEDEFLNRINMARENELNNLTQRFKISNLNQTIGWFAPVATSVVSIGAYQHFTDQLRIEDIFTSLNMFMALQFPLRMLPFILNNFYETTISMARLEKYLGESEINEGNIIRDNKELKNNGISIKIDNGNYTWGAAIKPEDDVLPPMGGDGSSMMSPKKDDKIKKKKMQKAPIELSLSNNPSLPSSSKYGTIGNIDNEEEINTSSKSNEIIENKIENIGSLGINEDSTTDLMKPTIKNINIEIKKGEFICVIGEVGSGKSSLIQALLNSMLPTTHNSKIYVNGTISYVAQIPWIQNDTLKNNILFYQPFDEERYNKIIELSELKPDLEILEGGDLTEIGEKGVNLSGGQKARITIARALYAEKDIYLLDDPISALDANVGMKVMKNCIIKFLSGKTRILVTHALQYVSFADRIIYMKEGEIKWIGTYNEIKEQDFFKTFYEKMNSKNEPGLLRKTSKERRDEFLNSEDEKEEESNLNKGKIKRITKDEMKEEGKVNFKVYNKYIIDIGGWIIIFTLAGLLLIMNGFKGASDIWLGWWSDNQDKKKNNFYFFIYSVLGLTGCIFNYCKVTTSSNASIKASRKIHSEMILNLIRAPIPTFHETTPKGQILNRLSKDINRIDGFTMREFNEVISQVTSFLSSLLICSIYQPYCLVFLPILTIIGYKISRFYVNCSREVNRIEGIVRSPMINLLNEAIPGTTTIRAFNYQQRYLEMFHEKSDEHLKLRIIINGCNQWYDLYLDLLSFSFNVFLVILTIVYKDSFSSKVIGILLTYCVNLQNSLIHGLHVLSGFENSMVDLERCIQYTHLPSEPPKEKPIDSSLQNWPINGKIQFIDYSVKYRPDTEEVLHHLNFEINGHEKIGIAGRTGSGKSTITLCLFRILEPLTGKILIDDVDISTLGLDKLRKNITIIPQDPTLMEGTLRFNIDPLNLSSDSDIIGVMSKINFDYILNNNPLGLNQIIAEGGSNLSVGEKQLICITRAILRKSKIIVMDEATASIDFKTEEIIQKAINEILKTSTVITIAHRIKTIINYDRIITLDKGNIVDFDNPQKLLQKKSGLFYELYTKSAL